MESGIPQTIATYKESGIHYLESEFQGVESKLQDCLVFPFMGWQKAFDIALCNNCILTLLNGSFYRNVSHILVRYESLKVKLAAKS